MAKKYSDETRAAVFTALLQGQAVTFVSKEYNIPQSTVQTWKKQMENGELTEESFQKNRIADLIIVFMERTLEALSEQAEHTKDKKWLEKQSAESLAVLMGVQTDKIIRLLEAMSKQDAPNDSLS